MVLMLRLVVTTKEQAGDNVLPHTHTHLTSSHPFSLSSEIVGLQIHFLNLALNNYTVKVSTVYNYAPNFEKVGRAYCFRLVCLCVCEWVRLLVTFFLNF